MIVTTYKASGLWYAATSTAVIAYGVSRAAAVALIATAVDGLTEIEALLDSPATPEVWRATYLSALAHEAESAREGIEALGQSQNVERLAAKLAILLESAEALRAEIAAERQAAEQYTAELQAHREAADRRAAAAAEAQRQADESAAAAEAQRQADEAELERARYRLDRYYDGTASLVEKKTRKVVRHFASAAEIPSEYL